MESYVAFTEEVEDLDDAVEELVEQAGSFSFKKNTLAVLFTVEDTDYDELYKRLREHWDFPIVGSTVLAMFLGRRGYHNDGTSVMFLSADDCEFSVGMTAELDTSNYQEEIRKKYEELAASHTSDIKLILTYGGMLSSSESVPGDDLVDALDEVSGGVPIYGASASDSFSFDRIKIFCNDDVTEHGQAIALISGNIDPLFVVTNSVQNRAGFSYQVSESHSNEVFRLGEGTFIDALKKENMETEKKDVFADYLLSPFLVDVEKEDGDVVEAARCLTLLDQEKGSGSFLGRIPEGATLNIGIFNQNDVQASVTEAFETMLRMLEESDGGQKTLMCTSCCARFLAMGSNTTAEVDTYQSMLPEHFSLLGNYGNGEYCPVKGNVTGREYNMFHNLTFTIMAL